MGDDTSLAALGLFARVQVHIPRFTQESWEPLGAPLPPVSRIQRAALHNGSGDPIGSPRPPLPSVSQASSGPLTLMPPARAGIQLQTARKCENGATVVPIGGPGLPGAKKGSGKHIPNSEFFTLVLENRGLEGGKD